MKKILTAILLFACAFANANTPFAIGHYLEPVKSNYGKVFASYYIASTGNDATGDGSISNPWLTLYKACTTVTTSGNTIFIAPGTYLETQTAPLAAGVSIEGADSANCIIRGTMTANYVPIITASSVAEGTDGSQSISNLKFDGQSQATSWAISIVARKNVSIHHCTFINFNDVAVYWKGKGDNASGAPSVWATGNSFHHNRSFNCSRYTFFGTGHLFFGGQQDFLIYDNYMVQNTRGVGQDGWLVKCQINDGYSKNCQIYNNYFEKGPAYGGTFDFGVESFFEENFIVHDNTFNGCGLDMNYQLKGSYAHGAHIYNNSFSWPINPPNELQTAITLEFTSEDVLVENNTMNGAGQMVLLTPRAGNTVSNLNIRNNLSYNMGWQGFAGTGFFGVVCLTNGLLTGETVYIDNYRVEHNTLITTSTPSSATSYGFRLPDGSPDVSPMATVTYSNGAHINNNIIQGFGNAFSVANPSSSITGLEFKNNIIYNNGNSNNPIFNGGTPSYTSTGNIYSSPDLNGSYVPNTGSPAINAATDGTNIGHTGGTTPPSSGGGRTRVLRGIKIIK
jgi:hypothetical protein